MNKIRFAHIAPIQLTAKAIEKSSMNMVLAHVADQSTSYREMFKASDNYTLLDNGAFENGVPMGVQDMIAIGEQVGADTLVLPDYPFSPWRRGWDNIEKAISVYKDAGFKVMFIPQSLKDDAVGYYKSLEKALEHPHIDQIGLSILACPNAGLLRRDILEKYQHWTVSCKRFHILGMLGSVEEVAELRPYNHLISGWDSSAAVWYGVNNRLVEGSYEKFTDRVDFETELPWNNIVDENIQFIEELL